MPKDQTTKWREAKQRYRARVKNGQAGNQNNNQDNNYDNGPDVEDPFGI